MSLRITIFRSYSEQIETLWLDKELKEGRLRQGWGASGLSLKKADGRLTPKTEWDKRYHDVGLYKQARGEPWDKPWAARFSTLCRMLELKDGEVVIVPKMPEKRQFTIACVAGCYRFKVGIGNDFGHIIPVDPESVRTFDYDDNADTRRISDHFGYGGDHMKAVSSCEHGDVPRSCYMLL